jgi:hypothetical protein
MVSSDIGLHKEVLSVAEVKAILSLSFSTSIYIELTF